MRREGSYFFFAVFFFAVFFAGAFFAFFAFLAMLPSVIPSWLNASRAPTCMIEEYTIISNSILRVLKKVNGHCDLRAKTSHDASIRYVNAGFAALVAVSTTAPLWSLVTHAERRSVRLLADLK